MALEKPGQKLAHIVNCCNGRVGRELLELAEKSRELQKYVIPTGVEILKGVVEVGLSVEHKVNCCNGRVGKRPVDELIEVLGGG
jgi:hypothetical protein